MCRRSWLVLIFTLTVIALSTTLVLAQTQSFAPSPYVYKIKIAGCSAGPAERRQTGFRVKDKKGIVTALHGVVGCTTINAEPGVSEAKPLNDLIIAEVDIDRDMALLWSEELDALPAEGYSTIVDPQNSDYQGLYVIGYPSGLLRQKPTVQITVTETTELGNLVSEELIPPLAKRGSPAIGIEVLSVEGHLLPGHSGAPLLNGNDQVVGVANGGLNLGRTELTWAIPWHAVKWEPVSSQVSQQVSWADVGHLQKLKESGSESLFNHSTPSEVKEPSLTRIMIDGGDYVQVVARLDVNLRESPGINHRIVDQVRPNSILEIIGGPETEEGVEWWYARKIEGNQQGWVASSDRGGALIQFISKIGKSFDVLVIRPQGLDRFKSPNTNGERIDVLKRGEVLQVIAGPHEDGGKLWYRLSKGSGDEGGWVLFAGNQGIYLEPVPDTPTETPTATPSPTLTSLNSSSTITPTLSDTSTPTATPTNTLTLMDSVSELDWVVEQVRISSGVDLKWTECPGEPNGFCVRWNMYRDNNGVPVEMEILNCRQEGSWLDDRDMEQYGLDIGIYKRVSGITIRRDCLPTSPTGNNPNDECMQLDPVSLGNQKITGPVFVDVTTMGECRVFSHYPTGASVRYDSIALDDDLEDVRLVCGSTQEELKDRFESFSLPGQLLTHWRSSKIDIESGCRIDFIVRDAKGDKIGLMIKSAAISASEPTPMPPLPTPMLTKGSSSAASTVKREEVEVWSIGEVSNEQVTVCLGQVHAGPRPFQSFAAGEQIPAGVLVATNYGEAGRDWHEFPLQPICHLGSWGLFETIGSYPAPYEGAYWTIIERPTTSGSPILCVPDGVIGHETANPLYKLPTGYRAGWITSDPSDLILPDGTITTILERYVLFVTDVAEVQIRNVAVGSEHSNTWGCWFREDLTDHVLLAAEEEFRKMKLDAPTVAAGLYRLDSNGLTKVNAVTTPTDTPTATVTPVSISLSPTEVRSWCRGDTCNSGRFEQLREANGVINPGGVKFRGGNAVEFTVPESVSVEVWDCFNLTNVTGPVNLSQVCEATFRKTQVNP